MAQTRTNCPRCRQPLMADVEQLFDLDQDPEAKQKLLSGGVNVAACQNCGYQGMLPVPIIYHDSSKELLLTYFPPELMMPVNEQERMIGPMITKVVNRLPPEKRKGYLLRPQAMLTMQTLIERILEGDGITREMIEGQQKRLNLLQRLMMASLEARPEIIKQDEALIDQDFFGLLNRLMEMALGQGDEQGARQLAGLQQELLTSTEVGRQLQGEARETEAAIKSLQEASQTGLTREKLLDLIIEAPTETRMTTLVSMARNGLDYAFFELLTKRIDASEGDDRAMLMTLREKLLQMTREMDQQMEQHRAELRKLINALVAAPNLEEATLRVLEAVDEIFVDVLRSEIEAARKAADLERSAKLQQIAAIIQKASTPPEVELIEKLLTVPDEPGRRKILEENSEMVTPEFLQMINGFIGQAESQGQPEAMRTELQNVYRLALRFSMENNLKA